MRTKPAILVIEDEPVLRANLARLLTFEGYEVTVAADGAEGLARARALRPDLVICDMRMPELTGDQVLHALREDPATRDVPFFFLTASADHYTRHAPGRGGADAFLVKPLDSEVLLAEVKACLERAGGGRSQDS